MSKLNSFHLILDNFGCGGRIWMVERIPRPWVSIRHGSGIETAISETWVCASWWHTGCTRLDPQSRILAVMPFLWHLRARPGRGRSQLVITPKMSQIGPVVVEILQFELNSTCTQCISRDGFTVSRVGWHQGYTRNPVQCCHPPK